MPELPEVETIVRALRMGGRNGPSIQGLTLTGADVLWERSIVEPQSTQFRNQLAGQVVRQIYRRGKFICMVLDRETLFVHLRMSGDLRVESALDEAGQERLLQKHDRVVFHFAGGLRMAFNDARKFGRIWLAAESNRVIGSLGPEPLASDFSPVDLYQGLQKSHRQLKPLLLDQSFLAGLGNIYTDESLHAARLHPGLPSNRVSQEQAAQLWAAIRRVLEEGIQRNGASIDWVYRGGNFQNHFRVYQRTGKPCPVCETPIQRRVIGQRSTHFCPVCQPEG
jgi:formamidopyrimidine-DNA glycosylase